MSVHPLRPKGRRRLAIAVLALGIGACRMDPAPPGTSNPDPVPSRVAIGAVEWYVDYEAALAVAREQDKALWVHFGENPG